ncbi:MAG TPA: hypothetical protein VFF14_12445 [Candidatus Deferrimicrobium sp.]|nr:hypothetical protein [Candidatus Deferrimicrobium sp.]
MKRIDAKGMYYRQLNELVKQAVAEGEQEIILDNVNGQRYIGDGISSTARIIINGTPGNDMAAYMDGLELIVNGNGQDAPANTMNNGKIVFHGNAGDTVGYAMRGGKIFVRGHVGYRVGIHMKEYQDRVPTIVVGGKAGDFFGEYMAGGILMLLGLNLEEGQEIVGNYCGTGMHAGVMYVRGEVAEHKLGKEVKVVDMEEADTQKVRQLVEEFCNNFGYDPEEILSTKFSKLIPFNKRPYGNLYCPY